MKPARLSAVVGLKIEDFAAGEIVISASKLKNLIVSQYDDGRFFVTQRPAVNIVTDASADVSDAKGRGTYYWGLIGATYFVNGPDVYKDSYSAPVREAGLTNTNVTQAAGTATVTVANSYAAGDTVVVSGVDVAGYNGTVTLLTAAAGNFTYAVDAGTASPATVFGTSRRTMTEAVTRVYILELATYLVFLDPENDEAWYVTSAASTTLVKITDADFPETLSLGGVVLNGRAYVMDKTGILYSSAEGNPTAWAALDTIQANYSPDKGMMLDIHNKHIVAYGANTIEYFYDNGNPTGSPLAKRLDIVHEIGAIDEDSFWTDNNVTFFVGISRTGGLSVYIMADFQVAAISDAEIDSFLTTAYMKENKHFYGCSAVIGGRSFYFLTVYQINSVGAVVTPLVTLVFSALEKTKTWGVWELMHAGIDHFPIASWTLSTSSTIARGILTNGDIITFQDDIRPADLTLVTGIYEPGIYEPGIYVESGGEGDAIEIEVIFGQKDFATAFWKRMDTCMLLGVRTKASQILTLSLSDEVNDDYVDVGEFDMSVAGERVNRLGSFRSRNLRLAGAPTERIELEGLEPDIVVLAS